MQISLNLYRQIQSISQYIFLDLVQLPQFVGFGECFHGNHFILGWCAGVGMQGAQGRGKVDQEVP